MLDLPYIEFDPAAVRVQSLLKNEEALAAIRG